MTVRARATLRRKPGVPCCGVYGPWRLLTLPPSLHRAASQINTKFVEQVKAMEARAVEVGVGGKLSYIWPSHYAYNFSFLNATNALRAEELGLKDRILNDVRFC